MLTFMLPSVGAFSFDGTIIIILCVLGVMVYLYKNKSNISLKNQDTVINEEENLINNLEENKDFNVLNEEKTNVNESENSDYNKEKVEEPYNKPKEKIKV